MVSHSVCLNTVAILFITEIDNVTYTILLSEATRARVEKDGRVELQETEAAELQRSKAIHVVLLVLVVLIGVQVRCTQLTYLHGMHGFQLPRAQD